ncbi:MAG: response regulator transcription factor [Gaiellales bacterium]
MEPLPCSLPDTVRILLVEDDPLLRTALSSALEGDWSRIVGVAASAAEAMAIVANTSFDVLLTDLDLGSGPNGAVLAHALRQQRPMLGIVVLTSYVDPRLVGPKLSQLPSGTEYVTKQSVRDLDLLRTAVVRAAVRGSAPLLSGEPTAKRPLTDTQIETMRLVAEGLSNAEIAERRFVTEKSVEVTVSRILKQLGIASDRSRNARVEIARTYYAMAGSGATAASRTA